MPEIDVPVRHKRAFTVLPFKDHDIASTSFPDRKQCDFIRLDFLIPHTQRQDLFIDRFISLESDQTGRLFVCLRIIADVDFRIQIIVCRKSRKLSRSDRGPPRMVQATIRLVDMPIFFPTGEIEEFVVRILPSSTQRLAFAGTLSHTPDRTDKTARLLIK